MKKFALFYRFKLIKWWAQSFLIGIASVICGFRDDSGVVRSLESYSVNKMPSLTKVSIILLIDEIHVQVLVCCTALFAFVKYL